MNLLFIFQWFLLLLLFHFQIREFERCNFSSWATTHWLLAKLVMLSNSLDARRNECTEPDIMSICLLLLFSIAKIHYFFSNFVVLFVHFNDFDEYSKCTAIGGNKRNKTTFIELFHMQAVLFLWTFSVSKKFQIFQDAIFGGHNKNYL